MKMYSLYVCMYVHSGLKLLGGSSAGSSEGIGGLK